jgi:hypothetical protein
MVLLLRQAQPNAAAPNLNAVPEHLIRLKIRQAAPTLRHFDELLLILEVELAGQGCLRIGLKKGAMPSLPMLERHVNSVPGRLFLSTFIAGSFSGTLRRGEQLLAPAADLAGETRSCS